MRREKRWKKGEKDEKGTERKMGNMHLLKLLQDRSTWGVKIGGKRARRARKVTERKMDSKHLLEAGKVIYICKGE
jgi:hypothetical protein